MAMAARKAELAAREMARIVARVAVVVVVEAVATEDAFFRNATAERKKQRFSGFEGSGQKDLPREREWLHKVQIQGLLR